MNLRLARWRNLALRVLFGFRRGIITDNHLAWQFIPVQVLSFNIGQASEIQETTSDTESDSDSEDLDPLHFPRHLVATYEDQAWRNEHGSPVRRDLSPDSFAYDHDHLYGTRRLSAHSPTASEESFEL